MNKMKGLNAGPDLSIISLINLICIFLINHFLKDLDDLDNRLDEYDKILQEFDNCKILNNERIKKIKSIKKETRKNNNFIQISLFSLNLLIRRVTAILQL